MNIVEIENTVKDFLDLTFIGFCFELPIHIENDFYIIGLDYEDKVGISCKNNSVHSLSDSILFINSSLKQFIDCLLFFNETFSFEEEYSDALRSEKMKVIRNHFLKIDKECLFENTWWSYILEQVEDGIL